MRAASLLLDTCAVIWVLEANALSDKIIEQINAADQAGGMVWVSPVTAWELGMLVARGRLAIPTSVASWFSGILQDGVKLAPLTPEILVESSFLPGDLHGDPADRMLAATARSLGCHLVTRDRRLLDYAKAGYLQAIAC